jgi:hypothetical protein
VVNGPKNKDVLIATMTRHEELINRAAEDGWELTAIDEVTSVQQPGCLPAIFGARADVLRIKLAIFKKEIID